MIPVMSPFSVEDNLGIGLVVCMLIRYLDKGKHQSTLQFESVIYMHSACLNCWHASNFTLMTVVLARDVRKTYITSYPSYSLWLE